MKLGLHMVKSQASKQWASVEVFHVYFALPFKAHEVADVGVYQCPGSAARVAGFSDNWEGNNVDVPDFNSTQRTADWRKKCQIWLYFQRQSGERL